MQTESMTLEGTRRAGMTRVGMLVVAAAVAVATVGAQSKKTLDIASS